MASTMGTVTPLHAPASRDIRQPSDLRADLEAWIRIHRIRRKELGQAVLDAIEDFISILTAVDAAPPAEDWFELAIDTVATVDGPEAGNELREQVMPFWLFVSRTRNLPIASGLGKPRNVPVATQRTNLTPVQAGVQTVPDERPSTHPEAPALLPRRQINVANRELYAALVKEIEAYKSFVTARGGVINPDDEQIWFSFARYTANAEYPDRSCVDSYIAHAEQFLQLDRNELRERLGLFTSWQGLDKVLPEPRKRVKSEGIPLLSRAVNDFLVYKRANHSKGETKERKRESSHLRDVRGRLNAFVHWAERHGIHTVAVSPLDVSRYFYFLGARLSN